MVTASLSWLHGDTGAMYISYYFLSKTIIFVDIEICGSLFEHVSKMYLSLVCLRFLYIRQLIAYYYDIPVFMANLMMMLSSNVLLTILCHVDAQVKNRCEFVIGAQLWLYCSSKIPIFVGCRGGEY